MTAGHRAEWPEFVVVRADGRYFAEHYRVGFLFEIRCRWVRQLRYATKFPSERIARRVLDECWVTVPVEVRRMGGGDVVDAGVVRHQQPTRR